MIAGNGDLPHAYVNGLVTRFYDQLWNEWGDAAVDGTLAPDVKFRGSLGQTTVGRDGWRGYRDQIRRGAPDFHNEVLDLIAADDRAAARLRFTGTHRGRFSISRRLAVPSPTAVPPSSPLPLA